MGRMVPFPDPTVRQVINKIEAIATRRPTALKVIDRVLDLFDEPEQATGTEGPRGHLSRTDFLRP